MGLEMRLVRKKETGKAGASGLVADLASVAQECVPFLDAALEHVPAQCEFLFRAPGDKDLVDAIVAKFESGENNVLGDAGGSRVRPCDVASVLKKYLTDSVRPLFSKAHLNTLLKHASKADISAARGSVKHEESMKRFAQAARRTMKSLDADSQAVLTQTVGLLHRVSLASSTKMSTHALGIVFAPVFFLKYIPLEKVQTQLKTVIWVTETMLEKFHEMVVDQENANRYHRLELPHFKRNEFSIDTRTVVVAAKAERPTPNPLAVSKPKEEQQDEDEDEDEVEVQAGGDEVEVQAGGEASGPSNSRLLKTRSDPNSVSKRISFKRMSVRGTRETQKNIARASDKSIKRSSWLRDLDLYRSKQCHNLVHQSRNSTAF